ncbi:MAG: DedA family protein [Rubellimicrobium sp.]|nr:DedA family protein [Rubellimicrobium sp.]
MTGDSNAIVELLTAYGLWILAPLSIVEGPIVTIIAGWLASLGIMQTLPVLVCVVLGDVIGDAIVYAGGRGVRLDRLPVIGRWFRIPRARLVPLVRQFRRNGVRILLIGKLTQGAGAFVLIAAGAARMPFGLFILVNFLASIPKSMVLMAVGWLIGEAHARIAGWLSWGSGAVLILALGAGGLWILAQWRRRRQEGAAAQEGQVE